ncbi:MAG: hypothetical protein C0399_00950 [Syntrophus sp. (in: bacteria)]|nr:hypothetical protein [Syntrophus sp. (in: bacteria)]
MPAITFQRMKIVYVVKALTYLIGILSFIALYIHINPLYSFLFLFMFAASLYFEFRKLVISRWMLTAASLVIIVIFLFIFNLNDFVTQMLEALLMLLGIKFLEQKQVRDYMQIYAISLFLLSGMGLLALGIIFIIYVLLFVFILSISFIFLTYYAQEPELELTQQTIKRIILKCLWIPLLAIPLSVVMFVILPRSQYPLLDFLNRPDKAKTGFTDKVRLGEVSDIQEDTSIIFRATMDMIDEKDLYWRGITLDYFDGTSWRATAKKAFPGGASSKPFITGRSVRQTIYLEPYQNSYLFCLDKPLFVSHKNVKKLEDLTFTSSSPIERRVRYETTSLISDAIYEERIDENKYLQIPQDLSLKIIALTNSLTTQQNPEGNTRTLLQYLNKGQYRYSLQGLPISKNPLEAFLFESKYGNCEYFASAMAIMLRVSGIPSRMVGGYRGGYYNNVGKYYLVPQKNAHVWVEAYLPHKGWVRLDPTPASADMFSFPLKGNMFLKMSLLFDTINYYWYTIVINYNLEKQLSIGHTIIKGLKKPSLPFHIQKRQLFVFLIIIAVIAFVTLNIRSFFSKKITEEEKILSRFLRKMERKGYRKTTSQGLEEFVHTIEDKEDNANAYYFVSELEKIFYKDNRIDRKDSKNLKNIIKHI